MKENDICNSCELCNNCLFQNTEYTEICKYNEEHKNA